MAATDKRCIEFKRADVETGVIYGRIRLVPDEEDFRPHLLSLGEAMDTASAYGLPLLPVADEDTDHA